jgi:hypothetical protein
MLGKTTPYPKKRQRVKWQLMSPKKESPTKLVKKLNLQKQLNPMFLLSKNKNHRNLPLNLLDK